MNTFEDLRQQEIMFKVHKSLSFTTSTRLKKKKWQNFFFWICAVMLVDSCEV